MTLTSRLIFHKTYRLMSCRYASQAAVKHGTTLTSVYNDCVYNYIPVIAIEFHGPAHDASI